MKKIKRLKNAKYGYTVDTYRGELRQQRSKTTIINSLIAFQIIYTGGSISFRCFYKNFF